VFDENEKNKIKIKMDRDLFSSTRTVTVMVVGRWLGALAPQLERDTVLQATNAESMAVTDRDR
jgi:hypothetical protein